jgi:protein-tyrosine phosphatase
MLDHDVPERAQNFRSLGGLQAAQGRRIREGVLFRTGDMGDLTAQCRQRLQALRIRGFVDLRSRGERRARPYEWPREPQFEQWGHSAKLSDASIRELLQQARSTAPEAQEAMNALYKSLVRTHVGGYSQMFTWLAAGRAPMLIACSAGKDRTGVATALLLWSLGVSRDDIVKDYLKSNDAIATLKALVRTRYGWSPDSASAQAVLVADAAYLETMFEEIERCWGTIHTYLDAVLGVDAITLRAVESHVLE